jgi:hypothetical protein
VELAFRFEALGDLVFAVDVFEHIAVDDRLVVGLAELVEDVSEMPEMLGPQDPRRVEILAGQSFQPGRWRGRQAQPDRDGFSVLEGDGSARAGVCFALQGGAVLPPQLEQQRFDVLAGPQGVDGEIRAGAVVLEKARAAHGDAVGLSAGGLHAVVAIEAPGGPRLDLDYGAFRPFPPFGYLLLHQHVGDLPACPR